MFLDCRISGYRGVFLFMKLASVAEDHAIHAVHALKCPGKHRLTGDYSRNFSNLDTDRKSVSRADEPTFLQNKTLNLRIPFSAKHAELFLRGGSRTMTQYPLPCPKGERREGADQFVHSSWSP